MPISGNASPFDAIRRTRPDGSEYWSARELMPLLGYSKWQDFSNAIDRAKIAVEAQGNDVTSNFMDAHKITGTKPAADVELTRFAAYQVAMCGDPRKPEVAAALAYFAIKTREAETAPALTGDPFDLIIAQAQAMKQIAAQANEAQRLAQHALARIDAITPTQADEIYYSARAWARINGVESSLGYLLRLGIKAGRIGRAAGLTPDKVPDRANGTVNGWPLWVWDNAFDAIENAVAS